AGRAAMPGGYHNQARMSISTTGTGTFTLLAAIAPWNTFDNAGVADGEVVPYSAVDGTANSEKGWGVYTTAGTTLTRNVFQSTSGNNAINASSATQVFIDPSAADLLQVSLTAHATLSGL